MTEIVKVKKRIKSSSLLLIGLGFALGVLSNNSFMYFIPNSPLDVREKAFKDTAVDYIALLDKHEKLISECK